MVSLLRRHGLDLLIGLAALGAGIEVLLADDLRLAPGLAAALILAIVLTLLARRRWPFGAPAGLWLLAAALSVADGRLVVLSAGMYLAGMAAAFLLGNLRDDVQGRLGAAIVVGSATIIVANDPAHDAVEYVLLPVLFGIVWLAGFALRERACRPRRRSARAGRGERGRGARRGRRGARADRARAARHRRPRGQRDGAAGRRRPAPSPARSTPRIARRCRPSSGPAGPRSREMRQLLGAMRQEGDEAGAGAEAGPRQPRRDAATRCAGPGCPCGCTSMATRSTLPPAIDLSAYRIIQEGLTNALKHAHATQADVLVRYAADDLQIEVRDDGRGVAARADPGHGLVGVRERVKIYGGEMTAGAASERRVRAAHPPAPQRTRPMSIRVLVADDQSMVRAGFRMLLSGEPDIEVVAEAGNGADAVSQAARFAPTVVLMDIRMPVLDGLEATRRILAADAAAAGPDPHDLRPRRVRLRGAAGRSQRLRPQGRPARAADRRGTHDRRR